MTTETQATHTPGPWQASKGDGLAHWNISGDGQCLANVPDFIGSPTLYDRVGQGEANARLIAAAPSLLAALQTLVRADNTNYERDTMRYEGFFDAARDAIEQATGRRF